MHTKSHEELQLFVETNPNYSLDSGGKASALTSNTKSGNYKALSFPFVSNASPAEGAAACGGNIRKITGFRKSRQRGSGLDGDNRPERYSQTGRRRGADKKNGNLIRMMDVKKRLQKGVHATHERRERDAKSYLNLSKLSGDFSIFLQRRCPKV